jgi:hypothetical protein
MTRFNSQQNQKIILYTKDTSLRVHEREGYHLIVVHFPESSFTTDANCLILCTTTFIPDESDTGFSFLPLVISTKGILGIGIGVVLTRSRWKR